MRIVDETGRVGIAHEEKPVQYYGVPEENQPKPAGVWAHPENVGGIIRDEELAAMCGVQTAMAMTSTFWRYTETPGEIEGYWYDTPAGA
ncbi:MAG: hypothetical protein LBS70_04285, partial [Candidatus Accumulibacter sp.]|nr:hypothetical protein [Accumulibacter sp.]